MGCDIHSYIEKKNEDGTWEAADTWTKNQFYEEGRNNEERQFEVSWETPLRQLRDGRNYLLFGFLSKGVRYDREDGFKARGIPEDVSTIIKEEYLAWDVDAHSASYLALPEIKKACLSLMLTTGQHDEDLHKSLKGFIKGFGDVPEGEEDNYRVVFWFDN